MGLIAGWWALTGSNRRPSRCKRDALPTELSAPVGKPCGIAWFSTVARGSAKMRPVRSFDRGAFRSSAMIAAVPAGAPVGPVRSMMVSSVHAVVLLESFVMAATARRCRLTSSLRRFYGSDHGLVGPGPVHPGGSAENGGADAPTGSCMECWQSNVPPGSTRQVRRTVRPIFTANYAALRNLCPTLPLGRLN